MPVPLPTRQPYRQQQPRQQQQQPSHAQQPSQPATRQGRGRAGPGAARPIKHIAPKGESLTAEYHGWAITRVGLGRLDEDDKTFSLEWGITLGPKGRFEIQHDKRRLCVVLRDARPGATVQLYGNPSSELVDSDT